MQKLIRRSLWFLLPIFSFLLYEFCHTEPVLTETIYSEKIYPVFTSVFSFLTGHLPFSLAEFLLIAAVVFVLFFLFYIAAGLFRKGERLKSFLSRAQTLAIAAGFVYSFFVLFWSLNFARLPLAEQMGYKSELYSAEELASLTNKLIDEANALRSMVGEDEEGCFILQTDKKSVMKKADDLYEEFALPLMKRGGQTSVKTHTLPKLLSYGSIQGVYSPFTFEPNVNSDMPDLYFAASCCHEYAHFKGFCREDEAEFISFFVCRESDDIDFRYSGTVTALTHALSALRGADREAYLQAQARICDGVWRDYAQHNLYWDAFEGKAEEISEAINDSYLKSNKQESGIRSYGRMLDILLAMQRAGDF